MIVDKTERRPIGNRHDILACQLFEGRRRALKRPGSFEASFPNAIARYLLTPKSSSSFKVKTFRWDWGRERVGRWSVTIEQRDIDGNSHTKGCRRPARGWASTWNPTFRHLEQIEMAAPHGHQCDCIRLKETFSILNSHTDDCEGGRVVRRGVHHIFSGPRCPIARA